MRRAFIIAAILILVIGIGVIAYFALFRSAPGVEVAAPGGSSLPVAGGGTGPDVSVGFGTSTTSTPVSPAVPVTGRLVKISRGPVVFGEAVTNQRAASSSPADAVVSYIERRSGNMYTYSAHTRTITRVSNRTVPGIQSAAWLPSGAVAFVRYLSGPTFSTINTYALSASGLSGFFLAQNISDIAVASTSILTLASGVNGSTASLSRADGTHATTVFSTPLTSLRIAYAGKSQYLAVTKASSLIPGYAYLVDGGGRFTRAAGPLLGLSALPSPSGKWLFVSSAQNGSIASELINMATGEEVTLPIATLSEKCVWTADSASLYCGVPVSPPGNASYPDDWYQGALSFSDRIWKIQVEGRYAQLVLDLTKENGSPVDVVTPAIDTSGTFLVFANKNDSSLWGYSL